MAIFSGIIPKEELVALVPHKGKMFLLSRVRAYDTEKHTLTAECDIAPDCLFYDPALEGTPSWVGVEFMAQGISALYGIIAGLQKKPPMPGFILSISALEIGAPIFRKGSTLEIEVIEDYRLDAVYTYNCRIREQGRPLAKGKMTVLELDQEALRKFRELPGNIQ